MEQPRYSEFQFSAFGREILQVFKVALASGGIERSVEFQGDLILAADEINRKARAKWAMSRSREDSFRQAKTVNFQSSVVQPVVWQL